MKGLELKTTAWLVFFMSLVKSLKTIKTDEELLGLFKKSGAVALDISKILTGFGGRVVMFTNLSCVEFQVRYLALFLLFSVIDGFEWFWVGILSN